MSTFNLPEPLLGEALKTTVYILNRFRVNSLRNIFELQNDRKPSLKHFHIWGYPTEVKLYNSQLKKTDSKLMSCFGGYRHIKGLQILLPFPKYQILESINAKLFKNGDSSGNTKIRELVFQEEDKL